MTKQPVSLIATLFVLSSCICCADETINLSGRWRFALDRESRGKTQAWFRYAFPGTDEIQLPGSLQSQGYGDVPGPSTPWTGDIKESEWNKSKYAPYRLADNFKMPFWLQPERYYKGAAWYQRTVVIPPSWRNRHITLLLERPHWETTVWVDSRKVGSENYLSVPHVYDLSDSLTPGEHCLTICVDNREVVDVGINSHSISDHTQSNWNGIVGILELRADPAAWIEDVQVYPDMKNGAANVQVRLGNRTGKALPAELRVEIACHGERVGSVTRPAAMDSAGGRAEVVISLNGRVKPWDEFNPHLYTLKTRLQTKVGNDEAITVFGMREATTEGNRILLNGRHVFMRGTLECCIFPKTGYPPTDIDSWKRLVSRCKAHGLNHIRFHSWCPPEVAFIAADELGFYYQVECASWAGVGNGQSVDGWLYDEADAILEAYGNHPSFMFLAYGNEPAGPEGGAVYLRKWVSHYKQTDPRRLVTSGSGWPHIEQSDFHVSPAPRIQGWGQELKSRINSQPPETMTDYRDFVNRYPNHPVIAHEIGQWCVYPNFDEINKYTGVLKPKNFEIFRDFLDRKQMLDQAHDFLMASGKLQTLCYKEDIESALRTPNFGGLQLLDLHDFPGQGTALVGVLDPFWDSKPYVSPEAYRTFCDAIVPLVRLSKRLFTSSEALSGQVEVSHFGPADLTDATLQWQLLDAEGRALRQGVLGPKTLSAGDLHPIGAIHLPLFDLPAPAQYTLTLTIEKTRACNNWDIWIYPDAVNTEASNDIRMAETVDESCLSHLQNGGKVLLALNPARVKTDVQTGFSSIFWNTAWTGGQAPHTLGILCDPGHPALAEFPTEYHSNWQWSELLQQAAVLEMDALPAGLRPIVQVVPDWFEPKRLGLVFEANAGNGAILVCSIDIIENLPNRPAARQLRYSLLNYMRSDDFKPKMHVDLESIAALLKKPTTIK